MGGYSERFVLALIAIRVIKMDSHLHGNDIWTLVNTDAANFERGKGMLQEDGTLNE